MIELLQELLEFLKVIETLDEHVRESELKDEMHQIKKEKIRDLRKESRNKKIN